MKKTLSLLGVAILFSAGNLIAQKLEVAIIVDIDSPVSTIPLPELRSIFLKQKKTWPSGKTIVPLEHSLATREYALFTRSVLLMNEAKADAYWIERKQLMGDYPPQEIPTDKSMIMMVDVIEGAVGYVNRASLDATALEKVKIIAMVGE